MAHKKTKTKKTAARNSESSHSVEDLAPEGQPIAGVPGVGMPGPGVMMHLDYGPTIYDVRVKALELACGAHTAMKIKDEQGCITTNEEIVATADAFYTFLTKKDPEDQPAQAGDKEQAAQPALA